MPAKILLSDLAEALATRDEQPVRVSSLIQESMAEEVHDPVQLELFRERLRLEIELREEMGDPLDAPWGPVPLGDAQTFIDEVPGRMIEMVFPTVFEEDRSVKIKDIATAQGLDYTSHQWAAEQVAQELGREEFDYEKEMAQIQREQATLPKPEEDEMALPGVPGQGAIRGHAPPGSTPPQPSVKVPAKPGTQPTPTADTDPLAGQDPRAATAPGKRNQLAGPTVATFKRQQKQSDAVVRTLGKMIETLDRIHQRLDAPPQHITVEGAQVHVPQPRITNEIKTPAAPIPNVTFPPTPPPAPPRERTFEVTKRDAHGLAKEFRERYLPPEAV